MKLATSSVAGVQLRYLTRAALVCANVTLVRLRPTKLELVTVLIGFFSKRRLVESVDVGIGLCLV